MVFSLRVDGQRNEIVTTQMIEKCGTSQNPHSRGSRSICPISRADSLRPSIPMNQGFYKPASGQAARAEASRGTI
jgi:hypothetical protein